MTSCRKGKCSYLSFPVEHSQSTGMCKEKSSRLKDLKRIKNGEAKLPVNYSDRTEK
jgi:hypothetical protein